MSAEIETLYKIRVDGFNDVLLNRKELEELYNEIKVIIDPFGISIANPHSLTMDTQAVGDPQSYKTEGNPRDIYLYEGA